MLLKDNCGKRERILTDNGQHQNKRERNWFQRKHNYYKISKETPNDWLIVRKRIKECVSRTIVGKETEFSTDNGQQWNQGERNWLQRKHN